MDLILVRHGQAADASPAVADADRPLTQQGIKSFTAAAEGAARVLKPPARWITSPLRRARETAAILEQAMGREGGMRVSEALVPEADPRAILEELSGSSEDAVVIGHEPHLGALLGLLVTGRHHVSIPFKKGMIAGVRLDHPGAIPGRLFLALSEKIAGRIRG
jgi:phosphohistidine phosphatase